MGCGLVGTGIGYERMASYGASRFNICVGDRAGMDSNRSFCRNGAELAVHFGAPAQVYDPGQQFSDAAYVF